MKKVFCAIGFSMGAQQVGLSISFPHHTATLTRAVLRLITGRLCTRNLSRDSSRYAALPGRAPTTYGMSPRYQSMWGHEVPDKLEQVSWKVPRRHLLPRKTFMMATTRQLLKLGSERSEGFTAPGLTVKRSGTPSTLSHS